MCVCVSSKAIPARGLACFGCEQNQRNKLLMDEDSSCSEKRNAVAHPLNVFLEMKIYFVFFCLEWDDVIGAINRFRGKNLNRRSRDVEIFWRAESSAPEFNPHSISGLTWRQVLAIFVEKMSLTELVTKEIWVCNVARPESWQGHDWRWVRC